MSLQPDGRPPFRADHVGSLLRPAKLRQAFRAHADGKLTDDDFRALQDRAIREAVEMQERCGLQVVTDGEFRRTSYWARFVERTDGLAVKEAKFRFHDEHGHETGFTAPHVTGRVARRAPIAQDEFRFVAGVTRETPKVTLPSPSTMHFWRGRHYADEGVYREPREFFAELGAVYRAELAELAAAGARYVQLDEVALAMLCDPDARARVKAEGDDPNRLVDLYVEAINEAVRDRPPEMVIGVHMCRGNYKGMYLSEGGYDSVGEKLFNLARVNHFLLEFDTPRAGGFAPLRMVPKSKGVVLGMVSSKRAALESIDALKRRADEAATFIDASRLAISPQCGFASTIGGNPVTKDDERAKLKLCVDAARVIWG